MSRDGQGMRVQTYWASQIMSLVGWVVGVEVESESGKAGEALYLWEAGRDRALAQLLGLGR